MADGASFEILGTEDLMRDLQMLPQQLQKRVMKGTVATGCSVIRKQAIANAPVYTGKVADGHPPRGTLKKSIYQTRLVEECTDTVEAWKVDVHTDLRHQAGRGKQKGQRVKVHGAYYAYWVEFGHFVRPKAVKASVHRKAVAEGAAAAMGAKWVPPQPFMGPAFESKKGAALQAMQAYLEDHLPESAEGLRIIQAMTAGA